MKENVLKPLIIAIGSAISSYMGILYIPMILLAVCNIIDYGTGLAAAKNRGDGEISSYKSIRGIKKKIGMWVLVLVGSLVDVLLYYVSYVIGYALPFKFLFAAVVAIWIVCNELISILENLIDMEVAIPPFMLPLIKHIKGYTESKAELEESAGDENCKEENR